MNKIIEIYKRKKYKGLEEKEILELMLFISGYKNTESNAQVLLERYGHLAQVLYKEKLSDTNERFNTLKSLLVDFSNEHLFSLLIGTNKILSTADEVVKYLKSYLAYEPNEKFLVIFLNSCFELIKVKVISEGTIDKSIVFIRPIIADIIDCNAKNIIIAHNHPSGSLNPSSQDIHTTKKIQESIEVFEVNLLDHIIISRKGYYSFAQGGLV